MIKNKIYDATHNISSGLGLTSVNEVRSGIVYITNKIVVTICCVLCYFFSFRQVFDEGIMLRFFYTFFSSLELGKGAKI